MEVGAGVVVQAVLEEAGGFAGGVVAVHADEGHEVELEEDAAGFQTGVVPLAHVDIALGVGQKGMEAVEADVIQGVVEGHGRAEVGGLDEEHVAVGAGDDVALDGVGGGIEDLVDHREEFAGGEAAVEEGVDHVLGGEVEADGGGAGFGCVIGPGLGAMGRVRRLEFREAGAELGGGVGDVLHDVGGQPDFADARFLVIIKDFEGGFQCADAVIDAGEDVAVPVRAAAEEAAVEDGVIFGEGPHGRCFLGGQSYRFNSANAKGRPPVLHPHEDLFLHHQVQEAPDEEAVDRAAHQFEPVGVGDVLPETAGKVVGDAVEVADEADEVDEDGVEAEGEEPVEAFPIAAVDDPVNDAEEHERDAAGDEGHGTGPDVFVEGHLEAPELAGGEHGGAEDEEHEGLVVPSPPFLL